ncbi:MAG TPA: TolC family protein [Candidatus Rubrimentiphilum sp.]|nr:TolC family protein [Candidatus Rubrimentiphilum sp.]
MIARGRTIATSCLLLSLAAPASAGAAGLTLPDAVKYAVTHSPQVIKQQSVVAQLHEQYVKLHSASLPNATGQLQNFSQKSNNLQGNFAIAGISQARTFSQNTAQIGSNYTFDTGFLSTLQALAAKSQEAAAQADLRKTKDDLANSVAAGFYDIATKDETTRLAASDVQYQHVLLTVAQAKARAGVAAEVDVLRAQASEDKSRSTLIADQSQAANARETLAQLIGAPLDTAFDVPSTIAQPPLPSEPLDRLIAIAQANRPDIVSAQSSLAAAQTTRKGFDRELFPTVQMSAFFGNQFSPTNAVQLQDQLNSQFPPGQAPKVPRGSPGFWQLQAISTFTLPLWDYGARRSERENDDAQVVAAQNSLDTANQQVALEVRQAYRAAQTAQAQLQYAGGEVRAAVESARVARLQYRSGLIAIGDVLLAQEAALSSQIDLYNARVAYVEAIIKLRVALGIYDAPAAVAGL